MLYQIYDTQRSLMEPFADLAQTASKVFNNPLLPFSHMPMAQRISAAYDLIYRLGKDYEKPEFGIRAVNVDGVDVAIHERIEINKPFCELRRFKRFSDDTETLGKLKGQPAVLVVAPLSGHYATLLRDTVKTMLKDHKVYITDWKNARLVPLEHGEFHLDDYVNYVQEFIRHLQAQYGNCHVMSVCQPTVPVMAAVSLMASRGETTPLSMTMMGGPLDARKSPTAVNDLATQRSIEWFENNVIFRVPSSFPGAGRRVYPGFLQHTGFVAMNPDKHLTTKAAKPTASSMTSTTPCSTWTPTTTWKPSRPFSANSSWSTGLGTSRIPRACQSAFGPRTSPPPPSCRWRGSSMTSPARVNPKRLTACAPASRTTCACTTRPRVPATTAFSAVAAGAKTCTPWSNNSSWTTR
jgi:polyhydroxyalkanoate depolymerase